MANEDTSLKLSILYCEDDADIYGPMIQNRLLAALPETEHQDLSSQLGKVSVFLGEVLHQAHAEIQYVYFPETCVISLLSTLEDGSTAVKACWVFAFC
jgi:hypothetical protein